MLGLTDINNLTHKIENIFDAARKNELVVNGDVTELVFMGLDQLVALIDQLKEPGGEPVDCNAVLEAIRRLLQTAGVERKQSSQADAEKALSVEPAGDNNASSGVTQPETVAAAPVSAPDPLAGVVNEEKIPEKYLSIFIDKSETTLDKLTNALLTREKSGASEDLQGLIGRP